MEDSCDRPARKKMTEVKISKSRGRRGAFVESKFVCVIKADLGIKVVRDTVMKALAARWMNPEVMVQMISIPIELTNTSDSVPLVIIAKTSYTDINDISESYEKHDIAFIKQIAEELGGWYPKIYYKNK